MLQRRRPGSQDSRTFEIAIENMDKTDCFAIAADLFYITRKTSNQDILDYDYTPLIVIKKISINLGLNERFQQVLSSFVELYAKNDLLHPYVSEEDKVDEDSFKSSVMRRRNALNKKIRENFSFEEDKTISESEDFLGLEEDFLNFLRILLTKKYNTYSQVIYYTFFSKAKVSLSVFPEKLSEGFNKKMHDISKVKFIQKELKLSDKEAEYLLCRYRKGTIEYVNNLFNRYTQNSEQLYSKLLNISSKEFKHITRPDSKIRQFGFINSQKDLNPAIIDCIEAGDLSLYFADCIKVQELSQVYGLSSFAVPKQNTDIYKTLLKSENSISMLLYGAPGSGKTEYAKALIKSTGKKALIFKNEAELLDKNDVLCRLNCLLSLNRKDSILIIDEADSLLSTCVQTLFGPVQSTQKKGLVNKMLEASQNKVIWIVNYKSQIDESTLRRFTVSYKFAPMTTSMLESIAINKLNCLEIEADTKKEIISLLSQYKVTGASVDNLITTVNSMHSIDKDMDKDKLLENIKIILKDNSTLLHGDPKMRKNVKDTYDMSVLNTSLPAEKIVKMLQNAQKYAEKNPGSGSVKILLYGLSGTGKTEFSRYLGQCLGKDLLLKRASDIFDKYVGGTEHNIASAFQEAAANDKILLFDEADSFFSDRNNAVRNFERTQVNEFLTQLEEFPGIVICTTNLKQVMDPAMLRRFHITVDFKALTQEGIAKLLSKFFKTYTFSEKMIKEVASYNSVTPGDFSRLADTIKFMDEEDISSQGIIDELCNIQKEKDQVGGGQHKKTVGFCA